MSYLLHLWPLEAKKMRPTPAGGKITASFALWHLKLKGRGILLSNIYSLWLRCITTLNLLLLGISCVVNMSIHSNCPWDAKKPPIRRIFIKLIYKWQTKYIYFCLLLLFTIVIATIFLGVKKTAWHGKSCTW